MRICVFSLRSLPVIAPEFKSGRIGGAEVQLARLATALAARGHDVSMVVADYGQREGAVYEGIRTIAAFDPDAGWPMIRFVHPRFTGLWRAAAQAKADVYLCSAAGMIVGLLALFCRVNRRRLVYRVASDSDCDPSQLLIKYRRDRWLYRFGIRSADAVLVQSQRQQDAMLANFGRESTVVRSLADVPMPRRDHVRDIDVLWVANLRQLKCPERFLQVARALPQFRFCMAGGKTPGEEALYARIESEAKRVPNLEFLGAVPFSDVGALFDRTRLFANTSDIEGFPNTFLQAWARGVPVVTLFDPDGVVARLGPGTACADVAGMIESVETLLGSDAAYRAAAAAAIDYVSSSFSEDEILQPYLSVLSP